jgi:transposase-like protein
MKRTSDEDRERAVRLYATGLSVAEVARRMRLPHMAVAILLEQAGVPREDRRPTPGAKLTPADVREIRRRAAAGEPQAALGREFGLGKIAVHRLVHRQTWKNVE